MSFVWHPGEFLARISNAYRPNILLGAQLRQGAIVKARAIADPVALAIEGGQWHEQEVRLGFRGFGQRFFDCHLSLYGWLARAPQPEDKGCAKLSRYRQGSFNPGTAELFEEWQR